VKQPPEPVFRFGQAPCAPHGAGGFFDVGAGQGCANTYTRPSAVSVAAGIAAPPAPPERIPRRPCFSLKCNTDRTTSISVAVWANEVTWPDQTTGTTYSITFSRSYKDNAGAWHQNQNYRGHDIPVLLHLLSRAHQWCLDQRTSS
jgi:hypothetical protein